jgi:hypothetical protein
MQLFVYTKNFFHFRSHNPFIIHRIKPIPNTQCIQIDYFPLTGNLRKSAFVFV